VHGVEFVGTNGRVRGNSTFIHRATLHT
jgi:hypothetical protein